MQYEIKHRWISIHWWFVYWFYTYTSRFSNRNDHYKYIIVTKEWEIKEIEEWSVSIYSWFKDKNWKEIYSGDTIKLDAPDNWWSDGIVMMRNWQWVFYWTIMQCVHQAKQEYREEKNWTLLFQRDWQCEVL